MTLSLPDIHLTDLGKDDNGLTTAELTRVVLKAITTATIKAVSASATDLGKSVETIGKDASKVTAEDVDKVKKNSAVCWESKRRKIILAAPRLWYCQRGGLLLSS